MPIANGLSKTSSWSVLVGARTSQMTGTTKKAVNASRRIKPAVRTHIRLTMRMSLHLEELGPENEHHGTE